MNPRRRHLNQQCRLRSRLVEHLEKEHDELPIGQLAQDIRRSAVRGTLAAETHGLLTSLGADPTWFRPQATTWADHLVELAAYLAREGHLPTETRTRDPRTDEAAALARWLRAQRQRRRLSEPQRRALAALDALVEQ